MQTIVTQRKLFLVTHSPIIDKFMQFFENECTKESH